MRSEIHTLSLRERVAAKQPGEGLRRVCEREEPDGAQSSGADCIEMASSSRPPSAESRDLRRRPSVARASKSATRWLEVSETGADGGAHRRFRLPLGTPDNRSGRKAACGSDRQRSGPPAKDRGRRLHRDALHERRRSRPASLGDRRDSTSLGCSTDRTDAAACPPNGLNRAETAAPHPSPSATPSPCGRGLPAPGSGGTDA